MPHSVSVLYWSPGYVKMAYSVPMCKIVIPIILGQISGVLKASHEPVSWLSSWPIVSSFVFATGSTTFEFESSQAFTDRFVLVSVFRGIRSVHVLTELGLFGGILIYWRLPISLEKQKFISWIIITCALPVDDKRVLNTTIPLIEWVIKGKFYKNFIIINVRLDIVEVS